MITIKDKIAIIEKVLKSLKEDDIIYYYICSGILEIGEQIRNGEVLDKNFLIDNFEDIKPIAFLHMSEETLIRRGIHNFKDLSFGYAWWPPENKDIRILVLEEYLYYLYCRLKDDK